MPKAGGKKSIMSYGLKEQHGGMGDVVGALGKLAFVKLPTTCYLLVSGDVACAEPNLGLYAQHSRYYKAMTRPFFYVPGLRYL